MSGIAGIPPHTVLSPKTRLKPGTLTVIHIAQWWSLATGIWDKHRSLLIRWNGEPGRPLGNPVSHGYPTWFVLPEDLHTAVLGEVTDFAKRSAAESWLKRNEPEIAEL